MVAQNDGMALGALKAVEDAKLQDKIKVYGIDATPDALAAVKEGSCFSKHDSSGARSDESS